jgi:hypothetical protein
MQGGAASAALFFVFDKGALALQGDHGRFLPQHQDSALQK